MSAQVPTESAKDGAPESTSTGNLASLSESTLREHVAAQASQEHDESSGKQHDDDVLPGDSVSQAGDQVGELPSFSAVPRNIGTSRSVMSTGSTSSRASVRSRWRYEGSQKAATVRMSREHIVEREAKRKQRVSDDRNVENKVLTCVRTTVTSGQNTSKDMLRLLQGRGTIEDANAKGLLNLSGIFGEGEGQLADALISLSSYYRHSAKLSGELAATVESDLVQRGNGLVSTFNGALQAISASVTSLSEHVESARVETEKLFDEQEVAWKECEASLEEDRAIKPDKDPWLAGIRYEAQVKALDEVLGRQQVGIAKGVQEMVVLEGRRQDASKATLIALAKAERRRLEDCLNVVDGVIAKIDGIDPSAESSGFLMRHSISEMDLQRNKRQDSALAMDLGVWVPDDWAKVCHGCQVPFTVVKRKHHCRYCGHVHCDDCSTRKIELPEEFGYSEEQRVCDHCFDVLSACDIKCVDLPKECLGRAWAFEVLKEGWLEKKGHVLKGMRIKRRYFVVTRAGFMHYFDTRWGVEPLRSISLLNCSVSKISEDFRAFEVDMNEAKGSDFMAAIKKKTTPSVFHLIAKSQTDRDEWIAVVSSCCRRHGAVDEATKSLLDGSSVA